MTGQIVLVVVVLVATNVWVHVGPRRSHVWTGPLAGLALLVLGRLAGLSWAQLGLAPASLPVGIAVGLAGAALIAAAVAVAASLPRTRGAFLDTRYDLALPAALRTALVTIPLATVVAEECAFRGVIWGLVDRDVGGTAATVASSLLFGVWHVLPALDLARTSTAVRGPGSGSRRRTGLAVLGTVVGTALAGVVLAELRRRTGSLAAPFLVHWAANASGVIASSLVWARRRASEGVTRAG
ncbi:MAG TPA: CPBP family intramembrane glutamic endopeptidase [Kineosporiaceae bacterium]|nr:CPBP family intramembrane glutamic endopeptidase [Kineosporiaceae bacterium]